MDVSGNLNPFLFDEPAPPPAGDSSDLSNPFLSGGAFDFSASGYSGINPFSDQIDETIAEALNLFGDQTPYVPEKNPFETIPDTPNLFDPNNQQVTADIDFFSQIPPEEDVSVDFFGCSSSSQPPKPPPPRPPSPSKFTGGADANNIAGKPPPPRPPPPSKETKDLIQTVIGAMEATTDTLQYKLNTSVTPSPSPGGGQHSSRSPTPDIHITAPDKEPDAFSTIFGQTIELSDQEVDETSTTKVQDLEATSQPVQPPTSSEDAPSSIVDEFDLFGEVLPQSKPKTTQDILSLFNKPAAECSKPQFDLLSDDLISDSVTPEVQDKNEISDRSAIDLLSSGLDSDPEGSINKDIGSINPSSTFPELIDTDVEEHPTEVVGSPDRVSEKICEQDVGEEQTEIQQEERPISPEDELKSDTIKSESAPVEIENVDYVQTQYVSEETPVEFALSNETWMVTEPSIPEKQSSPPESRTTDETTAEAIFGLPCTIPDQVIDNVPVLHEIPLQVIQTDIADISIAEGHQIVPADPLDTVFGVKLESEPLSPAPFFHIPENIAPHPTPSSITSTGFDLFGEAEVVPSSPLASVTPGPETTGATLFETETPAPNVGMSLFGAGEEASLDIFAESAGNTMINPFAPTPSAPTSIATLASVTEKKVNEATDEEFDAFSARFENVANVDTIESAFDPFTAGNRAPSPWLDESTTGPPENSFGFGDDTKFDPFLSLNEPPPPPQSTPRRVKRGDSKDSDDTPMNVIIRPTAMEDGISGPLTPSPVPVLAPPPAAMTSAFTDSTPRFNPFDKGGEELTEAVQGITAFPGDQGELQRSESQETPPTPLFEEDQSVPLEPFPRTIYDGRNWEMHLRQPNKKKITGQRFWKKVFVKLTNAGALQLYNNLDDKEPFQELPLQPCYSVSDIGTQQFDQFGKIFTVKIQYIFYKERPGVRPGQISKAERITNKLSKFAQYAIAGDYEGVKEFASDVRKLGMPVEHAPQISQLLKLGTQNYEDLKIFASLIEEFMFKLTVHRDRALTYKSEEVQLTAVDEMYVEQDLRGAVTHMVARVRIFFLGFLTGMPEVDLGINDLRKQGHEVVGRHDIIPVVTEEWIRLEDIEFHCTVNQEEFEKTRHIKFKPPDACYIELMRYRVRPPKNRELPLQVKTKFNIVGKRVEIQCEILVPGFSGRKLGQVPCEDVAVRFPLPECWIYMFRVEKHFRYGSVKSAHRRTGKVKGIERFKGAVEAPESTIMEVTSGQAKYEHQHRAIVWRMNRLPKEGQGAYSVHQFTCKLCLTDYDQIPPTLDRFCVLEFTMPATTVSHCVMRSVSVTSEEPPEKYVRYLARHEYKVEIEFLSETAQSEYLAATATKTSAPKTEEKDTHPAPSTLHEVSSSDEST